MGVVLTPIVDAQPIALADLRDKVLAVDGQGELYQFLALIRLRDGSPLMAASGRITSHLSGLFFRTTRLLAEYSPKLAFVFDGAPPRWSITREGLIDLALLVGTDFNDGVHGIGPKKALELVQQHGRIEEMPAEIRNAVGDVDPLRRIYLQPNVTDEYQVEFTEPDVDGIVKFLCDERQFSRERVTSALERAFPPPRLFQAGTHTGEARRSGEIY